MLYGGNADYFRWILIVFYPESGENKGKAAKKGKKEKKSGGLGIKSGRKGKHLHTRFSEDRKKWNKTRISKMKMR